MIATTAITAFTIEQSTSHNAIKWCWTMSLVFSFLCVYISSNVVRRVGRFLRIDDTLHYVRVKKDIVTGRTYHPKRHPTETAETGTEVQHMRSEYGYVYLPSLSAVVILSVSRWALLLSVHTFLAGVGLMPYYWWQDGKTSIDSDAAYKGGRFIFLSFLIVVSLFTVGWMHVRLQHAGEQEDHDVRDRLIVGLEIRRQQHLDEQSCRSDIEWIAWRKQVKSAAEQQSSLSLNGGAKPDCPDTRLPSAMKTAKDASTEHHNHDLESGSVAGNLAKPPTALRRALSRFPLFGAVNDERVNFGQWIPTWRGRLGSVARKWLQGHHSVAEVLTPMNPILTDGPKQFIADRQPVGTTEEKEYIPGPEALENPSPKTECHTRFESEATSLSAMCRELAQVAEQYARSAEQQAHITAMLASHVGGLEGGRGTSLSTASCDYGGQGTSTGARARGSSAGAVSRRRGTSAEPNAA